VPYAFHVFNEAIMTLEMAAATNTSAHTVSECQCVFFSLTERSKVLLIEAHSSSDVNLAFFPIDLSCF